MREHPGFKYNVVSLVVLQYLFDDACNDVSLHVVEVGECISCSQVNLKLSLCIVYKALPHTGPETTFLGHC